MPKVEDIKHEIEELSESDFADIRNWIAEKDWQKWDRQIESDSMAGKLDFLISQAKTAKKVGKLREL